MLSKGQGNTIGTYQQLIHALDMDHRAEEAHNFWMKKIGNDFHSVPWQTCHVMISVYYRNNMLDHLVKVCLTLLPHPHLPDWMNGLSVHLQLCFPLACSCSPSGSSINCFLKILFCGSLGFSLSTTRMPLQVRLPTSGSPQTPRKRDPHWELLLLLLLLLSLVFRFTIVELPINGHKVIKLIILRNQKHKFF